MLLSLALTASLSFGCLPSPEARPLRGGLHQRFVTPNGPVHAWCPERVEPELLVVYVHGYFDSVDDAFRDHGLVEQFRASGVRALFVLIDGPKGPREQVAWTRYAPLAAELERTLGRKVPERVMAMGHSGGNRTLREWTKERLVTDLVLLDAFYGDPSPWTAFLSSVPAGRVQLVGALTFKKAEAWRRSLPASSARRVEQLTANTDHMGVITDAVWIPRLVKERATEVSSTDGT
ncbi:MAG: hypothetical protein JNJ54_16660 [Myxococcaceae bacterium]|nr:hypothetical protein [Myxococcaceae bacterium]